MIFQPFLFLFTLSFNSSSQYSKLPRLFIDLGKKTRRNENMTVGSLKLKITSHIGRIAVVNSFFHKNDQFLKFCLCLHVLVR